MTHQEFSWWLGGVMAATHFDAPADTRAAALEVIREQLGDVLTTDKLAACIVKPGAIHRDVNMDKLRAAQEQPATFGSLPPNDTRQR